MKWARIFQVAKCAHEYFRYAYCRDARPCVSTAAVIVIAAVKSENSTELNMDFSVFVKENLMLK